MEYVDVASGYGEQEVVRVGCAICTYIGNELLLSSMKSVIKTNSSSSPHITMATYSRLLTSVVSSIMMVK